jgi:branched-chain amino acid transport system substrate-binding protein
MSICTLYPRFLARLITLAVLAASLYSLPAQAQAGDTITLGVVLPTTGREGKPGTYQKEGIELAIKQINDKGGISVKGKKYKIKEVFYDDGSDSAKSASLTERYMTSEGGAGWVLHSSRRSWIGYG